MKHRFSFSFVSSLLFLLGSFVVVACSSSDSEDIDPKGSCSALASACHGVPGDLAAECHELGHAGDDATCAPRKAECLAACPASAHDAGDAGGSAKDAGGLGSNDAGGANPDASPDPGCVAYCACMTTACGDQPNYPFAADGVCLAVCADFSAEERSCFGNFCTEASDAGAREHLCEHATGKLGLAECP
jgi:hypothetical protein